MNDIRWDARRLVLTMGDHDIPLGRMAPWYERTFGTLKGLDEFFLRYSWRSPTERELIEWMFMVQSYE